MLTDALRSLLYIPVLGEKFIARASERGADGIILDLEDAIAPHMKEEAREALPQAIQALRQQNIQQILVRINRPLGLAIPDIKAAIDAGADALCLPKIDHPEQIHLIDEYVDECQQGSVHQDVHYLVLIETARGIQNVADIAQASPRIKAITMGNEDLAADLGLPDSDPELMASYDALVRLAARAAGVISMGYNCSIAEFTDLDKFEKGAREGARMGHLGGMCIHPKQVPCLNRAFQPDPEDVVEAEALLDAFNTALAQGLGAVAYKGKMIDKPIVERAERLVARAKLIGTL